MSKTQLLTAFRLLEDDEVVFVDQEYYYKSNLSFNGKKELVKNLNTAQNFGNLTVNEYCNLFPNYKFFAKAKFRLLRDDEIVVPGHYCGGKGSEEIMLIKNSGLTKPTSASHWRMQYAPYEFYALEVSNEFFEEKFDFLEGFLGAIL